MTHHLKEEFWDRIEDVRVGMLSAGSDRFLPMSHQVDDESHGNALWFITADGTDVAQAATAGSHADYTVTSMKEGLYAHIKGKLSVVDDTQKLNEIWSVFAAAWFEDGREDDDVMLVRFDLSQAEVWATDGKLAYLYEVAKANLTDETADTGDHGTVIFHKAA